MAPRSKAAKGVVLAAGLGTRLRPLTERWPKPLIPFAGTSALELALWRLAQAGLSDIAVNAHYLPDAIAEALKANLFGQTTYLAIEPEILGTGGVYNPLRLWQGDADLVVINGDVISTIDIAALLDHHRRTNAVATMALLPNVIVGESAVYYDEHGVRAIGRTAPTGASAGNFACAQVLSPAFLDLLPKSGSFDIISKGYQIALDKGLRVASIVHDGFWHDLRTPSFYAAALKDFVRLEGLTSDASSDPTGVMACRQAKGLKTIFVPKLGTGAQPCRIIGPVLLDGGTSHIDLTATIGPDVVAESGVTIGKHAVVRSSVLLPGAHIKDGVVVESSILGDTLNLPIQA